MKIKNSFYIIILTALCCVFTALTQGFIISKDWMPGEIIISVVVFYLVLGIVTFLLNKQKKLEGSVLFYLFFILAMFIRSYYIFFTGLHDRQHDEGFYTSLLNNDINPGHLGYVEYLCKFHTLPKMNPYALYSYYHPPLHFIISAIWVLIQVHLGVSELVAFTNIQVLTLLYSALCLIILYDVLKMFTKNERLQLLGLSLVAFHPAFICMSGSVNNDMLATVFLLLCLNLSFRWINDKSFKWLILDGLCIAFGMLTKLNVATVALPLGVLMLMEFISAFISFRKKEPGADKLFFTTLKDYIIFALVTGIIGTSNILRNLIGYGELPGIYAPKVTDVMYTGDYNYWQRFGLCLDYIQWHFEFPFHPKSGDVIHNLWIIMFQTGLFTEVYPAGLSPIPLFLCQLAYISSIIAAICCAIYFTLHQIKLFQSKQQKNKAISIFLLLSYYPLLFSFILFSIKYPYTCSGDFRYVVISLAYMGISLAVAPFKLFALDAANTSEEAPLIISLKKIKAVQVFYKVTVISTLFTLALITLIYLVSIGGSRWLFL